jgi:O-antigen/teichoic acid export membrane protein
LRRLLPSTEEAQVLARGAGLAFGLQVAGAGLAFILQVLLARWLGASEFGAYTFTIGWATLVIVCTGLGAPTLVLRFIPTYVVREDFSRLRGLLQSTLFWTLIVSVGVAILGSVLVGASEPSWLGSSRNALLGLWLVPLVALMTLQQEIARAFQRLALAYAPSLVIRPLLVIVGSLVFLAAGGDLHTDVALAFTVAAVAIGVVFQAGGIWRQVDARVRSSKPRYELRRWSRTALPLMLIASFSIVLMQTDIVFVGAIKGDEAAGLYGAASKTASLVSLILIAVNAIAAPMFSSLFAENRQEALQRLTYQVAEWIFWPSLLVGLFLAVLATPVLGLFGSEFGDAKWLLIILLVGQVVSAGAGSVGWLMTLTGHQNDAAWVYGWVALIHIALLAVAVPLLGTTGAALVTTASLSLWNIWLHVLVVRRLDIHPSIVAATRNRGKHSGI